MLSAMADDEAGDIGTHRILAEEKDSQDVQELWRSYHLIRATFTADADLGLRGDFLSKVQEGISRITPEESELATLNATLPQADEQKTEQKSNSAHSGRKSGLFKRPRAFTGATALSIGGIRSVRSLALAASFTAVVMMSVAILVLNLNDDTSSSGGGDLAQNTDVPVSGNPEVAQVVTGQVENSYRIQGNSQNVAVVNQPRLPRTVTPVVTESAPVRVLNVNRINSAYKTRFVERRLSVYKLDHANKRVVNLGFTPFIEMATFSSTGGGKVVSLNRSQDQGQRETVPADLRSR